MCQSRIGHQKCLQFVVWVAQCYIALHHFNQLDLCSTDRLNVYPVSDTCLTPTPTWHWHNDTYEHIQSLSLWYLCVVSGVCVSAENIETKSKWTRKEIYMAQTPALGEFQHRWHCRDWSQDGRFQRAKMERWKVSKFDDVPSKSSFVELPFHPTYTTNNNTLSIVALYNSFQTLNYP